MMTISFDIRNILKMKTSLHFTQDIFYTGTLKMLVKTLRLADPFTFPIVIISLTSDLMALSYLN